MTVRLVAAGDPAALTAARAALQAGGIVGIPTETVYGLAVLPRPDPLAALLAAKARSMDKGIALLIDDLEQVSELVQVPEVAQRLAATRWPGALTLVLPLRPGVALPDLVTGGRATLAVRMPDHPVPRDTGQAAGPSRRQLRQSQW